MALTLQPMHFAFSTRRVPPHSVRCLLVVLLLVLAGCASPGPYRLTQPPPSTAEPRYRLGFVEFDEQGWFYTGDRAQLSAVEKMVVEESHLGQHDDHGKSLTRGIILVAFVHGWQNNASEESGNVRSFEHLLATLAEREATLDPTERHTVVGVYLGWPGLSIKPSPLKELTFYSRKATGDKVGYYGGVTETLLRLRNLHSQINGTLGVQGSRSYFIVAGHSFGAQVVYNSLAGILTENLINRRAQAEYQQLAGGRPDANAAGETIPLPPREVIRPFGDLIILVNPAFEAARYYNLKTLSALFDYAPEQRPVIAIFSAKNDSATKVWFPVGRFFSTLFATYRDGPMHAEQRAANHTTIPWMDDYVTHELVKDGEPVNGCEPPTPATKSLVAESNSTPYLKRVVETWGMVKTHNLPLGGCVLCPIHCDRPWTPFYVVRVNKSIVNEHGGIWGDDFSHFIESFVTVSIREDEATSRTRRAKTE